MKTISYVPSICKEPESKWSGEIVLRLLTFDEKCEYIDQVQDMMEKFSALAPDKKNMKMARVMVQMSKPHYVSCKLKRADGLEISSFDEMQYEEDLHNVMVEVSGLMAQGFKVGNG